MSNSVSVLFSSQRVFAEMVYGGHLVIRLWETLLVIDHMEITDSITNAVLVYIMLYGKKGQENTQE